MSNGCDITKLKSIVLQYGLTLKSVQPYDSHYKRAAAYCALTDQGQYLIKPFYGRTKNTRLTPKEQIVKISSYVRKLQKIGYPHMPKWLSNNSGSYWVSRHGRPYYMTKWIEGRKLQTEEQDYHSLGRALASLHSINIHGMVARPRVTMNLINGFKKRHYLFQHRLTDLKQDKRDGYWFKVNGDKCITLCNDALSILENPLVNKILSEEKYQPATLIHGDVTFPNIIIQTNTLFLIDWDMICVGSTYYEVAKTLANLSHFNPSLIQALLKGYEEIKPLLPEERLLIRALFGFPREAWMTANVLKFHGNRTILHVLKQTWDARLDAVQWMDQWARMNE